MCYASKKRQSLMSHSPWPKGTLRFRARSGYMKRTNMWIILRYLGSPRSNIFQKKNKISIKKIPGKLNQDLNDLLPPLFATKSPFQEKYCTENQNKDIQRLLKAFAIPKENKQQTNKQPETETMLLNQIK